MRPQPDLQQHEEAEDSADKPQMSLQRGQYCYPKQPIGLQRSQNCVSTIQAD